MLAQTIGDVLSFAVAISVSPIPIVGVVLMLATPRGKTNGPAFLLGWVVGLALVSWLVVFVVGSAATDDGSGPATWVLLVQLVLGIVLVALAGKQFVGRPRGEDEPELPSWMTAVDAFSAGKSIGLGFALAAINPKNLLLVLGAAATIAQAGLGDGDDLVAIGAFVVIATIGPVLPVGVFYFGGEKAPQILGDLKTWLARNNAVIMAVIILLIGVKLIGQGVAGLG